MKGLFDLSKIIKFGWQKLNSCGIAIDDSSVCIGAIVLHPQIRQWLWTGFGRLGNGVRAGEFAFQKRLVTDCRPDDINMYSFSLAVRLEE